jgi:hypothetical protein
MLESTLISLGFDKDYMIDDETGETCCPHYVLNFPDFTLQGLPFTDDSNSWFVISTFSSHLRIEFDDELIQLVHLFRKNCRTED